MPFTRDFSLPFTRDSSQTPSAFSLSSAGSRHTFRAGTYDFDPRPAKRARRPANSDPTATSPPSQVLTKPLPSEVEGHIASFTAILNGWLAVKDGVSSTDFRKGCIDLIIFRFFGTGVENEQIAKELSTSINPVTLGLRC